MLRSDCTIRGHEREKQMRLKGLSMKNNHNNVTFAAGELLTIICSANDFAHPSYVGLLVLKWN